MSQENVEIVKQSFAALARRDFAAVEELMSDDVVLKPNTYRVDGIAFHGRSGVREWMDGFFETWREIEFSSRVIAAEDENVVVSITPRLVGQGSGAAVGREIFYAYTVRNRKISAALAHPSKKEALEAAGLSE